MLKQKLKLQTQKLEKKLLKQIIESRKEITSGKGKILKSLKSLGK